MSVSDVGAGLKIGAAVQDGLLPANAGNKVGTRNFFRSLTMKTLVVSLVAIWFGLVLILAANETFVRPPEAPPLPILLGVLLPLFAFVGACWRSERFRAF